MSRMGVWGPPLPASCTYSKFFWSRTHGVIFLLSLGTPLRAKSTRQYILRILKYLPTGVGARDSNASKKIHQSKQHELVANLQNIIAWPLIWSPTLALRHLILANLDLPSNLKMATLNFPTLWSWVIKFSARQRFWPSPKYCFKISRCVFASKSLKVYLLKTDQSIFASRSTKVHMFAAKSTKVHMCL